MKINIFKGLFCSFLLAAVCVKAEFEQQCLEVKDLTRYCEVNSEGKIQYV